MSPNTLLDLSNSQGCKVVGMLVMKTKTLSRTITQHGRLILLLIPLSKLPLLSVHSLLDNGCDGTPEQLIPLQREHRRPPAPAHQHISLSNNIAGNGNIYSIA